MTRLLLSLLTVVLVAFLVSPDAHARRFGGGKNFGKSYNYARQAKPWRAKRTAPGSADRNQSPQGAGRGRGGLLGPLAGLAAGGLLGALLFGGAFDGIRLFDLLVIGFLAFLGFRLFRAIAGSRRQSAYAPVSGGGPAQFRRGMREPRRSSRIEAPEIGAALNRQSLSIEPAWFNETDFISEAKRHFAELQRVWDSGDLDAIRDYVTPDFYQEVARQLESRGDHIDTRIHHLSAQLLDLLEDGDDVVAAILFSGELSEDGGAPTPFAEIWHVAHPAQTAEGPWRIAGIRQYPE